jgi:hypothetical protein
LPSIIWLSQVAVAAVQHLVLVAVLVAYAAQLEQQVAAVL